jgi:hypothetical protein
MMLIGDIHGDINLYFNIIDNLEDDSIQLGDFGLGFHPAIDKHYLKRIHNFPETAQHHKIFRGNHDDPTLFQTLPSNLGDWGMYKTMFFIAGGYSIDKNLRTPGKDWWPDEELNIQQLSDAVDAYEKEKPTVVISHDCPETIKLTYLQSIGQQNRFGANKTTLAMDTMFEIFAPTYWVYSHYHPNKLWRYTHPRGTEFVCIPINGTFKVPLL